MDASVRPDVAELDVKLPAAREGSLDGGADGCPILRVDELLEVFEGSAEGTGREPMQRLEAVRPSKLTGADVPVPHPHAAGVERQAQALLAGGQGLPGLP